MKEIEAKKHSIEKILVPLQIFQKKKIKNTCDMRPNFDNVDFKTPYKYESFHDWEQKIDIEKNWMTPEQIPVKPVYGKDDLEGM